MIVIAKIAEEMYNNSIQLKKYNCNKLLFKNNRISLEKELYEMQPQINEIICLLKNNPDYSNEHIKLAMFMSNQITESISLLNTKEKNYRNTVKKYVYGFHNLPRAFLPLSNSMCISPDEAIKYYKSYL